MLLHGLALAVRDRNFRPNFKFGEIIRRWGRYVSPERHGKWSEAGITWKGHSGGPQTTYWGTLGPSMARIHTRLPLKPYFGHFRENFAPGGGLPLSTNLALMA